MNDIAKAQDWVCSREWEFSIMCFANCSWNINWKTVKFDWMLVPFSHKNGEVELVDPEGHFPGFAFYENKATSWNMWLKLINERVTPFVSDLELVVKTEGR